MEITAYRLFYDNIHDFKTTAVHVEAEIQLQTPRLDSPAKCWTGAPAPL